MKLIKNLRSLKRQAKQAERFHRYKEEYKLISINVALEVSKNTRETLNDSRDKLAKIEDENTKVVTELAKKILNLRQQNLPSSLTKKN